MKKKLTIELLPVLHQQLEVYAKSKQLSVAAVVRLALLDYAEKLNLPQIPERPRKLSQAEMEAAWAEEDAKARATWFENEEA